MTKKEVLAVVYKERYSQKERILAYAVPKEVEYLQPTIRQLDAEGEAYSLRKLCPIKS